MAMVTLIKFGAGVEVACSTNTCCIALSYIHHIQSTKHSQLIEHAARLVEITQLGPGPTWLLGMLQS